MCHHARRTCPHSGLLPAMLTSLTLALACALAACSGGGGDGGGPTDPGGPKQPPTPNPPAPTVASITVTLDATKIEVGQVATPTAVARDAQGQTVSTTFTWSSSDSDVATLGTGAKATGMVAGTTTITATSGGISGSAALQVDPRNLDAMIETVRAARGLPAMAGAIVSSKGLIGIGVAGNRRIGGPPVTRSDRWHIGSNLKGITATLAALAVSRGEIDWTTTIEQAFPEHAATMRAEYRSITLEDLLAQRTGITANPPGTAYAGTTARQQREAAIAWALRNPPEGPRGGYIYSNLNFVIAGAMLERALDGTYEELLGTELGQPLGVTTLRWGPTTGAGQSDQPVGHHRQGGTWVACEACDNPPGLSAAGRANMSMGDWARFIQQMLAADAGRSSLITQPNQRRVFTDHTPIGPGDGYGLGWIMTTRPWGPGRVATHEGSNTLNHSVAWLGFGNDVALLAATNASDSTTGGALDDLIGRMLTLWSSGR